MNYASAAPTRQKVEAHYLQPLVLILPINKADFSKQGVIHKNFLELCQSIFLALPEQRKL